MRCIFQHCWRSHSRILGDNTRCFFYFLTLLVTEEKEGSFSTDVFSSFFICYSQFVLNDIFRYKLTVRDSSSNVCGLNSGWLLKLLVDNARNQIPYSEHKILLFRIEIHEKLISYCH